MVVQQSAVIVTQIGRVFAKQFIRELFHLQYPLSAKSPEEGNVPVKAQTSGELSDQVKKYVIVMMIVKMMF